MKTIVWVTAHFSGCHRYKDAPAQVAFLQNWHRHVFHVKLGVEVSHSNRDVEFFMLKARLEDYLASEVGHRFEFSCEQLAEKIVIAMHGAWCEVSEDGENGAWVEGLPACRKKTKCFIGTEAEGPHRGKRVLFVPGSAGPERFMNVWRKLGDALPDRVYYGAGNDHAVRGDTLRAILDCIISDRVDVELAPGPMSVALHTELLLHPNLTLIGVKGFKGTGELTYVKEVTTQTIRWIAAKEGIPSDYVTAINDPLFDQDQDME